MSFKHIHLIPPQVLDIAEELLRDDNRPEVKENYFQRLEAIQEYARYTLGEYTKSKSKKAYDTKGRKKAS